jgi:hypothetical protein
MVFLSHLYITKNILPRQARDKHRPRENSKKTVCSQVLPARSVPRDRGRAHSGESREKMHIFCASLHYKRSFYHDRLGTNYRESTPKRERCISLFEFSLCLSRACLGKIFVYIYIWLKKWRFLIINRRLPHEVAALFTTQMPSTGTRRASRPDQAMRGFLWTYPPNTWLYRVRKTPPLAVYILNTEHLPRQARDKHRIR